MARPDVIQRVRAILKLTFNLDHSDANEIKESSIIADVYETCGADSLDIVELMMDFEEEFGVSIVDEKCDSFITVGDLVNFIDKERG